MNLQFDYLSITFAIIIVFLLGSFLIMIGGAFYETRPGYEQWPGKDETFGWLFNWGGLVLLVFFAITIYQVLRCLGKL